MAINFPASPTVGQQFSAGGKTWQWTGVAWKLSTLQGRTGPGIMLSGRVATYAALPSTLGASDAGKAYLVDADALVYVWDGAAFPADGAGISVVGVQSVTGTAVDNTDPLNPVINSAGGGGSSLLDPSTLFVGLTKGLWLDFTDLSTMFQDTAGTIPVTAVGQSVALIKDKSGLGFHAVQATAAKQAKLAQDSQGFYNLNFASGNYYVSGKATNADPLMLACCVAPTNTGGRVIDNRGTGAAGTVKGAHIKANGTSTGETYLFDDGVRYVQSAGGLITTTGAKVTIVARYGLRAASMKYLGINSSVLYGNAAMGSIVNTNDTYIGIAVDGTSQPFTGNMYQAIAVGGYVTDRKMGQVHDYLSEKCGF